MDLVTKFMFDSILNKLEQLDNSLGKESDQVEELVSEFRAQK